MLTEPVKDCCEIGSILTIADARFDDKLSDEAQYIMFSQLLCTGKLIMSKTQTADEAMQNATLHRLNQIIKDRGSSRVFGDDVCRKDWDDLTDDDFESFRILRLSADRARTGIHAARSRLCGKGYGASLCR